MSKREASWLVAGVLAIGIFLGVALACTVALIDTAEAEDALVYRCWAICKPDKEGRPGEVMIRTKPDRSSDECGAAVAGQMYWTDWQESGGWLHLVDLNNETGEGWIYEGYVVFTEPETVNAEMVVTGCRQVACRKSVGGKRTAWAKRGTTVQVYMMDSEWAVTSRGYIQVDYLTKK